MSAIVNFVAKQYQKVLLHRLGAAGLRYDDILIEKAEVMNAIDRMSHEDKVSRDRRIKRAFDLSYKRKELYPEYRPQGILDFYLQNDINEIKSAKQERDLLNGY